MRKATHCIVPELFLLSGALGVLSSDPAERKARLRELKPEVDSANLSTVCDKTELELPVRGPTLDFLQAGRIVVQEWWKERTHAPALEPQAADH